MPLKLFKFNFSPPARFAWLAAKIYNVPAEFIDVDLSKREQYSSEFLEMNPKRKVPVFEHDGKYVTESREIAKYFHNHFNKNAHKNDHWYPDDLEERAKVDEWLDWSDERHIAICRPGVAQAIQHYGGPWREYYGTWIVVVTWIVRNDRDAKRKMMQCLVDGEERLSKRSIKSVEDLNLGDLAAYFEASVPFLAHPDVQADEFPHFQNLYQVLLKLPEFAEIDEAFRSFYYSNVVEPRQKALTPSIFGHLFEMWTTLFWFAGKLGRWTGFWNIN